MSKNALVPALYDVNEQQIPFMHDAAGETIWGTQQQIADLFGVDLRTVNEHLKNLVDERELDPKAVIRKFRITASDGKAYNILHNNLDAICAVGYRVKSDEAKRFRAWATELVRGAVVGRDYGTAVAETDIRQALVAIAQQNADTQRALVQNHNALSGEVTGLRLVVDNVQGDLTEFKAEVRAELKAKFDDDRRPFSKATDKKLWAELFRQTGGRDLLSGVMILDESGHPIPGMGEIHHIHSRWDNRFTNGFPLSKRSHFEGESDRATCGPKWQRMQAAAAAFQNNYQNECARVITKVATSELQKSIIESVRKVALWTQGLMPFEDLPSLKKINDR